MLKFWNLMSFEILYIFFNFQNLKFVDFWTLIFFWKILTPLPIVYWPPYPWNIDPTTHGISTPLPMVFWPPYPWYIEPLTMYPWYHLYRPPYPWYFDPPTHDILTSLHIFWLEIWGVQNTLGVQFSIRGFNIPWM
jgi:hypothetical protein